MPKACWDSKWTEKSIRADSWAWGVVPFSLHLAFEFLQWYNYLSPRKPSVCTKILSSYQLLVLKARVECYSWCEFRERSRICSLTKTLNMSLAALLIILPTCIFQDRGRVSFKDVSYLSWDLYTHSAMWHIILCQLSGRISSTVLKMSQ